MEWHPRRRGRVLDDYRPIAPGVLSRAGIKREDIMTFNRRAFMTSAPPQRLPYRRRLRARVLACRRAA